MRSLEEAGIGGQQPPFVRAREIHDRPFSILNARCNQNGYDGKPEMVATLRLLGRDSAGDPLLDDDGHELYECSWSAAMTYQRQDLISYFAVSHEPLGPCCFEFRAVTRPGADPYAHVVTYRGRLDPGYGADGGDRANELGAPPSAPARNPSPASAGPAASHRQYSPPARNDVARNFPNGGRRTAAPGSAPASSPGAAGQRSASDPPDDFEFGRPDSVPDELPF